MKQDFFHPIKSCFPNSNIHLIYRYFRQISSAAGFAGLLAILLGGLLLGCAKQDQDKLKERAQLDAEVARKSEQELLKARAQEMEADLERRQLFYQALTGVFVGRYVSPSGQTFETKLRLIPSLPKIANSDRVRTPEEIVADLNNLFFHSQILHWSIEIPNSAVGCSFENIRANLDEGKVDLAGNSCRNVYSVYLADPSVPAKDFLETKAQAKDLAAGIRSGSIKEVQVLRIHMQPANNSEEFVFDLRRVAP